MQFQHLRTVDLRAMWRQAREEVGTRCSKTICSGAKEWTHLLPIPYQNDIQTEPNSCKVELCQRRNHFLLELIVEKVVFKIGCENEVPAFSITCYRCDGAEASCESSSLETVECAGSSIPNAVFACQIYSVNYTTLKGQVLQFKGTVCTEMASCQSNKCNKDYATAIASQRPTRPSKACKVFFDCLVLALAAMACSYFFIL
ncbi:hypothetical protein P5673_012673 [Acropora cervicornis]|uniref:Uncharacterized protein n=1 Tax=Acropora cervicornis TaxID=6130 RepID=A0AAD9QLZ3_ACRCE|nr:hypothetical protein P5673_012673 [Acropora cervicornis]